LLNFFATISLFLAIMLCTMLCKVKIEVFRLQQVFNDFMIPAFTGINLFL
jgi:hypothetical protein